MEVYTVRLSSICVVKERGGRADANVLLLCVHYIPLLMLINIELKEKLVFGVGEIPGLPPLNKTLVCVCVRTSLFISYWLRWLLAGYT